MGTTAQKLTYLNETKQLLKKAINDLGGDLTEESTFRSYSNALDTIYNEYPKVTDTGEDITLENTKKGKMNIDLEGQTSQNSTTGKNLFGGFTFSRSSANVNFTTNKDGSITMTGTATATTYSLGTSDIATYKKTLEAGTYTLSGGTSSINLVVTDTSGTNIYNTSGNTSVTFTLNNSTDIVIRANVPNGTATNTTLYPMLETGSSATSYEPFTNGPAPNPDFPYPIKKVSGDNNVKIENKNLFDDTTVKRTVPTSGAITVVVNNVTMKAGTYRFACFVDNEPVLTSNIYSMSFRNGQTGVKGSAVPSSTITITSEQASEINNILLYFNSNFTDAYKGKEITGYMICKGNDLGDYESHKEQNFQLNLNGKNLFDFDNVTIDKLGSYGNVTVENNTIKFSANNQEVYCVKIDLAGLNLKNNTTYTVSNLMTNTDANVNPNGWRYYNGSTYTSLNYHQTSFTFTTTSSGVNQLLFYIGVPIEYNGTLTLSNIQLELGSTATTYEPYVEPLEVYEDGEFMQPSRKNLFDGIFELGIINGISGEDISNNNYIRCKNYIPVEELTNYKFSTNNANISSVLIYEYKEDFSYNLTTNKGISLNDYLTTNEGTRYIRFRPGQATTDLNTKFQMEKGTTATEYEPYGTNEWYLKNYYGKVVLDGSENWIQDNVTGIIYWYCKIIGSITGTRKTELLSNYFKAKGQNTVDGFYLNNQNLIVFNHGIANTLEDWETWLSTHNPIVVYPLDTPSFTKITSLTLIDELENIKNNAKSYKDVTNISQTNDELSFIITTSGLKI